jgi:hypothetical protein
VVNYTGPDHVQVDVNDAKGEMLIRSYSCGEIAIFPERTASGLAAVVFLGNSSCNQLHAFRYTTVSSVAHQQMNVVRSNYVVEYRQAIAFSCFKQPIPPANAIPFELEEKFPVVAPVGKVPDVSRGIGPLCSWHNWLLKTHILHLKL